MKPWVELGLAPIPGSDSKLRLLQRGEEFSIRIDTAELMNSRLSGSEEALATLTCRTLVKHPRASVLIGGLGMGFTLRAALTSLNADARIIVSELIPAVVTWARGPMRALFGDSLHDPRVTIREEDVAAMVARGRSNYNAILLDVDNGPEGMTNDGNDRLYRTSGLIAARTALHPGGVLAVWSARPYPPFRDRLQRVGFVVEEHRVRAHKGRRGASHMIWIATKPGSAPSRTDANG